MVTDDLPAILRLPTDRQAGQRQAGAIFLNDVRVRLPRPAVRGSQ